MIAGAGKPAPFFSLGIFSWRWKTSLAWEKAFDREGREGFAKIAKKSF